MQTREHNFRYLGDRLKSQPPVLSKIHSWSPASAKDSQWTRDKERGSTWSNRPHEETFNKTFRVKAIKIDARGVVSRKNLSMAELLRYFDSAENKGYSNFKRGVSTYRDLMILIKDLQHPTTEEEVVDDSPRLPAILPRTGMGFYLIDLYELKLICRSDSCLVLDHTQIESEKINFRTKSSRLSTALVVENFLLSITSRLERRDTEKRADWQRNIMRACVSFRSRSQSNASTNQILDEDENPDGNDSMPMSSDSDVPFEMVVLDTALRVTANKFSRQLTRMKSVYNLLMSETLSKPNDETMQKVLAFKKSLVSFETNVKSTLHTIDELLDNDLDMADLYLTMDREESDHEEVELLLEGYRSEIERIHIHCKSMRINIDDSKEYINTHQNETRNDIIRLNLYLEMVMVGVTFAAAVGSMFGMNLNSHIQDQYYAFFIVTGLIILLTVMIIVGLVRWVHSIMTTRITKNFRVLKDFSSFIDALELVRYNKNLTKSQFIQELLRFTNYYVMPDEIDLLYSAFQHDQDESIDSEVFQQVKIVVETMH